MDTINITPKERYQLSKKGVPVVEVKKLMQKFQLSQKQMSTLLSVSDKTLYSQLKEELIDQQLSDRFLLIQSVFAEGEEALMSAETFRKWLDLPHRNFDDQTPMTLLSTINGAEAVRSELVRSKYGILS
ncbi:MAG: antitoxin Xre/MbcA/ParS toxin-binding domain-containing protein [Cyclobacteriaceae bacterium]